MRLFVMLSLFMALAGCQLEPFRAERLDDGRTIRGNYRFNEACAGKSDAECMEMAKGKISGYARWTCGSDRFEIYNCQLKTFAGKAICLIRCG